MADWATAKTSVHVALFQKDMANLAISREFKRRAFTAAAAAAVAAARAERDEAATAKVEDAERPLLRSASKAATKARGGWGFVRNALESKEESPKRRKSPKRGTSPKRGSPGPPAEVTAEGGEMGAKQDAPPLMVTTTHDIMKCDRGGEVALKPRSPRGAGPKLTVADVASTPGAPLFSPRLLERTRKATAARTARAANAGGIGSVWAASAAYTKVPLLTSPSTTLICVTYVCMCARVMHVC